MFYLFVEGKGTSMSASKESLIQYMENSLIPYTIVEIEGFYSPSDLSLNENGEVIFPEIDQELLLKSAKTQKLKEVSEKTAEKIVGGFISEASGEKVTYDSDTDTQITMQGIALNVNTEQFTQKYPTGCPVRGYKEGDTEKTIQYLNAKQVLQWMADLSIHIGDCKQWGWLKQYEVEQAKTLEELADIGL